MSEKLLELTEDQLHEYNAELTKAAQIGSRWQELATGREYRSYYVSIDMRRGEGLITYGPLICTPGDRPLMKTRTMNDFLSNFRPINAR